MHRAVLAILFFGLPASAAEIVGRASVIDGDTIEIHGTRIRLHGIDAPESSQNCKRESGELWRCGQRAALNLSDYIGSSPVACEPKDKDRYGRLVAVCHKGKQDLNGWMVQNGWAVAYTKYSKDYVDEEGLARKGRQNIWSGQMTLPWEWRNGVRTTADFTSEESAPADISTTLKEARPRPRECEVKGNINAKGERIYHMPGSKAYAKTRINTMAGERWFCSEMEAVEAGWRPSQPVRANTRK